MRLPPSPKPPENLALTLTGWHSATPPSVPLGSQLQPGGQGGVGLSGGGPRA